MPPRRRKPLQQARSRGTIVEVKRLRVKPSGEPNDRVSRDLAIGQCERALFLEIAVGQEPALIAVDGWPLWNLA
jgi:hypothetical protein